MMAKHISILLAVILFCFMSSRLSFSSLDGAQTSKYPFSDGEDWISHIDDWKTLPPNNVSESDFYKAEYALIAGYSGSGGYFLERDQIDWLKRSVKSLKQRGIKPVDYFERRNVYRDSFYHLRQDSKT